ncbi:hypothetical protein VNO80_02144 [Phaseolus coccineus]|uniref:Uncharacterized protein n=1 Tax=Phaseolus coccineus TaxID=3886 RepID=A0AAN9RHP7_PHACN
MEEIGGGAGNGHRKPLGCRREGLNSKEAELLKDGFNADKSCGCAKQSPLTTDMATSMDTIVTTSHDLIDTIVMLILLLLSH